MSYRKVPLNVPVAHSFAPTSGTPTTMTVYGPSLGKSKSANNFGFVQDPASGPGWACSFLPDEIGTWTVVIQDGSSNMIHSQTFECVLALDAEYSSRLTSKYHGTINVYPDYFAQAKVAKQITSLTSSGTTATATCTGHGYSSSNTVLIYGATPQGYNGLVTITVVDANTFTYTVASGLTSPAVAITPANANPSRIMVTRTGIQSSAVNNTGSTYFAVVSTKKFVIPQTGYIYGIKMVGLSAITSMTSLRFFTMLPDGTYTVRGISEDFHATTPQEGSWSGGNVFNTIYFKNPVPAKVGDYFGLEMKAPVGSESTNWGSRCDIPTNPAATQELRIRTSNVSGISLTGSNTFATYGGGVFGMLQLKPIMRNPAIVLAGHSFYSGFSDADVQTCSIFDYNTQNNNTPFVPAYDIGALLEQELGVPVVNVAVGGSSIKDWVGQPTLYGINSDLTGGGWFEWLVAPLLPSVMLYDTTYNDSFPGVNYTEATYRQYLDRLLWHCDKYGIELVMMEGASAWSASQNTSANRENSYNKTREIVRSWCRQNNICLIPAYYRMGQNASTPAYNMVSFTVSGVSVTPTAGAIYTDGTNNFTVTDATSSLVTANYANLPTATSGTLTKVSGTGDATLTYSSYTTINVAAEATWQRWKQKDTDEFSYLPNYQGGAAIANYTHWQQAGRVAFANVLATGLRLRRTQDTLYNPSVGNELTMVQPGSRDAGVGNKVSFLANK